MDILDTIANASGMAKLREAEVRARVAGNIYSAHAARIFINSDGSFNDVGIPEDDPYHAAFRHYCDMQWRLRRLQEKYSPEDLEPLATTESLLASDTESTD